MLNYLKQLINNFSKHYLINKLLSKQCILEITCCVMIAFLISTMCSQTRFNIVVNSNPVQVYKKIEIYTDDIKNEINEHSAISFDIFDTLLIRPYVKPTDLFAHLEKLNNAPGFASTRIHAEHSARCVHNEKEDVTLDEIYQQIPQKYKELKEKEIALEYQVLIPRPQIEKIYKYACQQRKKIIFISDMYLPKTFLIKVLNKCGYTKFDQLYVSSEYGKTKSVGSLYRQVISTLNILPKDILHIGDNIESDVNSARRFGIHAFFIPKTIDCLFETDSRVQKFYAKYKKDIGASIMLGLLAAHLEHDYNNYWFDFGYKYAGPTIFGYMQWLDSQLKKDAISKVLFVGRDGYTLEKVFNLIKTSEAQSYYIYLPRKIAHQFFDPRQEVANQSKSQYISYLKQFSLNDEKLALIDSRTMFFSAQEALINIFPQKFIKGY